MLIAVIYKDFSNYKSEISNGTNNILNKISDLIKQGAVNIDNFTKTKLTEEEYNNLNKEKNDVIEFGKGAFENVKDASGELYNEGKQKVKELYVLTKKEKNIFLAPRTAAVRGVFLEYGSVFLFPKENI